MNVKFYFDPLGVLFVRCVGVDPMTKEIVGGSGFSVAKAYQKCLSECTERRLELTELWPGGVRPLGIAAHPDRLTAAQFALQEAAEGLCLKQIKTSLAVPCIFKISIGRFSLSLSRTSIGYFGLIRTQHDGVWMLIHSASASLPSTLLKVWNEFRSTRFFHSTRESLLSYSKGTKLFSQDETAQLSFETNRQHFFEIDFKNLAINAVSREGREIAYIVSKEETKNETTILCNSWNHRGHAFNSWPSENGLCR